MTQTIDIQQIHTTENIRTVARDSDFQILLNSIKQHGLFHPIGLSREGERYLVVYGNRRFEALKDLGYTELEVGKEAILLESNMTRDDFLIKNASENIVRSDNDLEEEGRTIWQLQNGPQKMDIDSAATFVGLTKTQAQLALQCYEELPEKYKMRVGTAHTGRRPKPGRIPAGVAHTVIREFPSNEREEILDLVSKHKLTARDVMTIAVLKRSKQMSANEAFHAKNEYVPKSFNLLLNRKAMQRLLDEHPGETIQDIIRKALKHGIRLPKDLLVDWATKGEHKA